MMQKRLLDRRNDTSITTKAFSFLDGMFIGTCYSLALILGVVSAQRSAAPDFSIPDKVILGLFLGVAIWATLSGISMSPAFTEKYNPTRIKIGIPWFLIPFVTSTFVPLVHYSLHANHALVIPWIFYLKLILISGFSFGFGGTIIGLSAFLIHHFHLRSLRGLRGGISLASVISFLTGLSTGWAVYGWVVFSSEFLFTFGIFV